MLSRFWSLGITVLLYGLLTVDATNVEWDIDELVDTNAVLTPRFCVSNEIHDSETGKEDWTISLHAQKSKSKSALFREQVTFDLNSNDEEPEHCGTIEVDLSEVQVVPGKKYRWVLEDGHRQQFASNWFTVLEQEISLPRSSRHSKRLPSKNLLLKSLADNAENFMTDDFLNDGRSIGENLVEPRPLSDLELPLRTEGRFIVDATGDRVKFACVNWVSHLEPLIPEGLAQYTPLELAQKIRHMGFNCIRYTYSIEMLEKMNEPIGPYVRKYMSTRTHKSFYQRNPWANWNTTVLQVMDVTLKAIRTADMFVVLDNHMTNATWCCGFFDKNRWWGQKYLKTDHWIWSLRETAKLITSMNWDHVVGIGLRNEPHTLNRFTQTRTWFQNMRAGAAAVAEENPDLLVTVSGAESTSYLKPLKKQEFMTSTMPSTLKNKIVYEAHYYNLIYIRPFWSFGYKYGCRRARNFLNNRVGFLLDPKVKATAPIWFSEFGLDVRSYDESQNTADRMWLQCVTDWMIEWDIDWAFWPLHSHYYFRQNKFDFNETWGLMALNANANLFRNEQVQNKLHRVMVAHLEPPNA